MIYRLMTCKSINLWNMRVFLVEWNEKINLTAITDDEGIVTKHFLDSLTAIKTGYVKGKVIDVGTGCGFPRTCAENRKA